MRTGFLLENLIEIADITKTEFAMSVYTSPSALSNILNGKRIPHLKDRSRFCKQAAQALTASIYEQRCHLKLTSLFPFIYEFASFHELEYFLELALLYSMEIDTDKMNDVDIDYPERAITYLGTRRVINMTCILLSNLLTRDPEPDLELHSTVHLNSSQHGKVLDRMIMTRSNCQKAIKLNLYAGSENQTEDGAFTFPAKQKRNFLKMIYRYDGLFDMHLWGSSENPEYEFIYVKEHFVLLYGVQPEGTPYMTLITHRNSLHRYYHYLHDFQSRKQTYLRQNVLDRLEMEPDFIEKILDQGVIASFNFLPIGYLVTDEELTKYEQDPVVRENLLAVYRAVLSGNSRFYLSGDVLQSHFTQGNIIAPLVGPMTIPMEKRMDYINRFNNYIKTKAPSDYVVLSGALPSIFILCTPDHAVLYILKMKGREEKFHVFRGKDLTKHIHEEMGIEEKHLVTFDQDLWDNFLQRQRMMLDEHHPQF